MMQQKERLETGIVESNSKPKIEYTLSFEHVGQHLMDVNLTFTAHAQQELWMPVWVPGSDSRIFTASQYIDSHRF
jgi:predicted metalloprotease with PDZ domain